MKAQLLTDQIPEDVTGWWISEKYDGIRAIWTGSKLLTRNGKDLRPPAWFIAGLPKNVRLDGELWTGRGEFDLLVSNLQRKDSDWRGIKYMVFDLAEPGAFEERYARLHKTKLPSHCEVVTHWPLVNKMHLFQYETQIVRRGGEGCVIRRPGCKYRPGRMGDVIKVKRLVKDEDRSILD